MSNTTYKQDLHDIAIAVAQNSKAYTDSQIAQAKEDLRWELGTYDLSVDSVDGTTMLLPTPANATQMNINKVEGNSAKIDLGIGIISNANIESNGSISSSNEYYLKIIPVVNGVTYYLTEAKFRLVYAYFDSIPTVSSQAYNNTRYILPDASSFTSNYTGYAVIRFDTGDTNNLIYDKISNFAWTGLKVEGSNILNPDNTFTYSAYTDLAYFECVGGATYTLKSFGSYTGSFGIFKYDGNSWSSIEAHSLNNGYTITAPSDAIRIGVNGVVSQNIMVVRGSVAPTDFIPYIAPTTKTIDLTSILYNGSPLFEENSLKAVGTAKDYITPYLAKKIIARVKLKDLNWGLSASNNFYCFINAMNTSLATNQICLCSNYTYDTTNSVTNKTYWNASGTIFIRDLTYEDTTTFTNHFTDDDYLYYVLATPIEVSIDWSSKLSRQTCYSNGSTTLLNTNNQDTTSQIDYLIEEVKA